MSEEPASPIGTRVVALGNTIQSMLFFEVNGDIVEGPPKAAMEAFGMKEFMMLELVFGSDDEAEDIAICVVSKSKLHGFELRWVSDANTFCANLMSNGSDNMYYFFTFYRDMVLQVISDLPALQSLNIQGTSAENPKEFQVSINSFK